MSSFVLSPCLIEPITDNINENMKRIKHLGETIQFIRNNLDIIMLYKDNSVFLNITPYVPPLDNLQMATYFASIILPCILELSEKGREVSFKGENYSIDESYKSVDDTESNIMCDCIADSSKCPLLFVGLENCCCNDNIKVCVDGVSYIANVVKDVYSDKTGFFDDYIKLAKNSVDVFPNKGLCLKIVSQTPSKRDTGFYKEYSEIIAKRNGYSKMKYDSRHYKANAPHFLRNDNRYAIVLDDVHGTFEVFDYTYKNPKYMGEYSFDGNLIENKTSDINTHRFYG